jgi:hypothetical protein
MNRGAFDRTRIDTKTIKAWVLYNVGMVELSRMTVMVACDDL